MPHKYKVIAGLAVLLMVLVLFLKLFTAVATQKGDPSVALIVKPSPSLNNQLILQEHENIFDYTVILFDENSFIGEDIYHALNGSLWIVLLVLGAAAIAFAISRRNIGQP